MENLWISNFMDQQQLWGTEPTPSASLVKECFDAKSIRKIFIPGIGNHAAVFRDESYQLAGSHHLPTVIETASKHLGAQHKFHLGTHADMPFDNETYEGIYAHDMIHLLNKDERAKFIQDCHQLLEDNGYMVFTAFTKAASIYGQGKYISKDRYEFPNGNTYFFYDTESIENEYVPYGLVEIANINEHLPMYLIKCRKN